MNKIGTHEFLVSNYQIITRATVSIVLWLLFVFNTYKVETESYLSKLGITDKQWVDSVILKPALFVGVFQIILFFYDYFIWRLIFTTNDYKGWWLYSNEYLFPKGLRNTQGVVYIKQTPLRIHIQDGKSLEITPDSKHQAKWESLAMEIIKDGEISYCYKVERPSVNTHLDPKGQKVQPHPVYIQSVEEISRNIKDRTGFPLTMIGTFRNCIEADFVGNTNAKRGLCKFVRISTEDKEKLIELGDKPTELNNKINSLFQEAKRSNNYWQSVKKQFSFIKDSLF